MVNPDLFFQDSNISGIDGADDVTESYDSTTVSWTEEPRTIVTVESTSVFYEVENVINTTDTFVLTTQNLTTNVTEHSVSNSSQFWTELPSTTTRTQFAFVTSIATTQMQWNTVNSDVTAAVFITIFIITSIVCNFFIIASLRHRNFKSVALYSLISNLCVVLMCDSLLNMSLILGATVANIWPYGGFMCQLSAFFVNVIRVETLLALLMLVLDRLVAIKYQKFYENSMNRAKANIMSGATWLYSTAFTLVILIGPKSIPRNYFPQSYLCNISANTTLAYVITLLLFCYVLPLLTILGMFIDIIKIAKTEKAEAQALNNATLYGFEIDTNQTPLSGEIRRSKSVGALVIIWCLLQGPYIFLHLGYTFTDTSYPDVYPSILSPSIVERIFAWMKFSYATVAPIVIFISWPEAKEELKNFICHKSNVVDSGRSVNGVGHEALNKPGVRSSWASSDAESVPSTLGRSFQIPILLATADGLRLKVARNKRETDIDEIGEVISTDRNRENRYMTIEHAEPLPPFGAVESLEEREEGPVPTISRTSKTPILPNGYSDRYQTHVQPNQTLFEAQVIRGMMI